MTPSTFLLHVVLCSLAIIAMWNTFQAGEIFDWIGRWVRRKATTKQEKPTVDCPVCMPSLWGSIYFWVFMEPWLRPGWWPLVTSWALLVLCVSGLNKLIVSTVSLK